MSNDEATPTLDAERACVEEARTGGVELLLPREVPLGGPRALPVLRSLPNKHRRMIGAWCFADAYGPVSLADRPGMDVPPHPHTGLQTVSWLVRGRVEHRDSIGSVHTIGPGGVNVMTAGRGIAHSEYSTADTAALHGVQLWTALPAAERDVEPAFDGLDAVPTWRAGAATVHVFAGRLGGQEAPVPAYSPLVGAQVAFDEDGAAEIAVDPAWEHGVLAITPGVRLCGAAGERGAGEREDAAPAAEASGSIEPVPVPIEPGSIGVLDPGVGTLRIEGEAGAIAILLGGEPWREEFVMFWNFIGPDHDAVAAARETWMREREAAPADRERFGTVADDAHASLPSPRIPDVVLLPQGRARRR